MELMLRKGAMSVEDVMTRRQSVDGEKKFRFQPEGHGLPLSKSAYLSVDASLLTRPCPAISHEFAVRPANPPKTHDHDLKMLDFVSIKQEQSRA